MCDRKKEREITIVNNVEDDSLDVTVDGEPVGLLFPPMRTEDTASMAVTPGELTTRIASLGKAGQDVADQRLELAILSSVPSRKAALAIARGVRRIAADGAKSKKEQNRADRALRAMQRRKAVLKLIVGGMHGTNRIAQTLGISASDVSKVFQDIRDEYAVLSATGIADKNVNRKPHNRPRNEAVNRETERLDKILNPQPKPPKNDDADWYVNEKGERFKIDPTAFDDLADYLKDD